LQRADGLDCDRGCGGLPDIK